MFFTGRNVGVALAGNLFIILEVIVAWTAEVESN
jgi:hypothetical protein